MSKTIQEERLRWVLPIAKKEIRIINAVKVCPYSQRTLERWVAAYKEGGEEGLILKSTRPKTNPNETLIRIKEKIIELRKETKQCALKLQWHLEEENINIHYQTIHKIIKKEGLLRKYKTRRIKYKYIRLPLQPGELMEIDVKYMPDKIGNKRYYQYTAIDCASRWRYLKIYDEQASHHSILFLKEVIERFSYRIRAIKTDNHSTFTNRYTGYEKSIDPLNPKLHALDVFCMQQGIIHYLIDRGKPQQNGKVERSHRSDQESFYDEVKCDNIEELRYKLSLWNLHYNNLRHCALNGKTPNEMLKLTNI